jgi:hypothetical protein
MAKVQRLVAAATYGVALRRIPEAEARALAFVTHVTTNFALILANRATGSVVIDGSRNPRRDEMAWRQVEAASLTGMSPDRRGAPGWARPPSAAS